MILSELLEKRHLKMALITAISVLLFVIAPNNKVVFAISFFHLLSLLMVTDTLVEALLYTFLPWLTFSSGRNFQQVQVPLEVIQSATYQSPVVSTFSLSPLFFLGLIVFGAVLFSSKKWLRSNNVAVVTPILLLVFYLFTRFFSAATTEYSGFYSVMYVFDELALFSWAMLLFSLVAEGKKARFVFANLIIILVMLFFTEICLSFLQLLHGGPFGLFSERAHYIAQFGMGADESEELLRVSGFRFHPNGLADSLISFLLPSMLLLFQIWNKKKAATLSTVAGLLVISALTLNRVSMITVAFLIILEWGMLMDVAKKTISSLQKFSKLIFYLGVVSFLPAGVLGMRILQRVYLSIFSFSETGGMSTRFEQYSEAIQIIFKTPYFGVGPDMFTAALYRWLPNGQLRYFPEKVHNGFLLIGAESGLVSLFLLGLIFFSVYQLSAKVKIGAIGWVIFFHIVLNMSFHRIDSHFLSIYGILLLATVLHKSYEN